MTTITDLYRHWGELEQERKARVASAATETDIDDVKRICADMKAVVAEVERRSTPVSAERVAALKAAPKPELPPDPRKPVQAAARKRPRAPMRRAVGVRVAP
jgi:hypothetical protein